MNRIDAAGGPPPSLAAAYAKASNVVEAAERELLGDDLGFIWLWPAAQLLFFGGAAAVGAYTLYKAGETIDRVADQVAESTRGVVKEVGKTTEVLSTILAGAAVYFVVQTVKNRTGKKSE